MLWTSIDVSSAKLTSRIYSDNHTCHLIFNFTNSGNSLSLEKRLCRVFQVTTQRNVKWKDFSLQLIWFLLAVLFVWPCSLQNVFTEQLLISALTATYQTSLNRPSCWEVRKEFRRDLACLCRGRELLCWWFCGFKSGFQLTLPAAPKQNTQYLFC